MNLKEMLNEVLTQATFLARDSFANSTDPDDKQMVAIANMVVEEIRDFFPWTPLRTELEIELQAGQTRYTLPSDYSTTIPESVWETDGSKQVDIPVEDGRWYKLKFSSETSSGMVRARFYGNILEVAETTPGLKISLEYISKWIVRSDVGAGKERFTADTDTFYLNDQMLIMGVKAGWADAKEMPQADKWRMLFFSKMAGEVAKTHGGRKIGSAPPVTRRDPYYPLYRT